ncbi:phage tail protein [Yersinia enterocolitica]|uniref:phage tail protein n=1 Tax=Yersinia enterocolitica TaxID=630 RepID=UPI0021E91F68|nr:phage tail protein [Yersinia enterocolitica]ELI8051735.1 phage tail protein [Yersinia enterocolitica]UYJ82745.1 phage tail protein [Yersinia enterocolitica]HDL7020211.1 phage tail protein [Yersinia enterocolitica]HDL8331440.1 phage tail protein [Yersinia enterocolitica]HDM8455668.1 phage tail protein [Yersinia enterocolitica]
MPETFTWSPQKGFTASRAPNVAVVKLGDGYEQRQIKGINPLMDSYSLTFMGTDGQCNKPNVAKQAEAFIKARMAVESFYWTPSDTGVQALYVCRSWSMKKTGPAFELSCTFEQVPR